MNVCLYGTCCNICPVTCKLHIELTREKERLQDQGRVCTNLALAVTWEGSYYIS